MGKCRPYTHDIVTGKPEALTGDKQPAFSTPSYPLTLPKSKEERAGLAAEVVLLASQHCSTGCLSHWPLALCSTSLDSTATPAQTDWGNVSF